jgi:hypothetical protein
LGSITAEDREKAQTPRSALAPRDIITICVLFEADIDNF